MAGIPSVKFTNSHSSQMRTIVAKIRPDQAHSNIAPKFRHLLEKLGITCGLGKDAIEKGILECFVVIKGRKIKVSPAYWSRAEAAIDLTCEIVDILNLKDQLPKDDLKILRLVRLVFHRLIYVKSPFMKNISDEDLEAIGNRIINYTNK